MPTDGGIPSPAEGVEANAPVEIILAGASDGTLTVYNSITGEALLLLEPWLRTKTSDASSHRMGVV